MTQAAAETIERMTDWMLPLLVALTALTLLLVGWLARLALRPSDNRELREELGRNAEALRTEIGRSSALTRQELGATLANFQQTLLAQQGDVARTQN